MIIKIKQTEKICKRIINLLKTFCLMKKIWVYLLGVLTGIVFTFLVLFVISLAINSKSGMTFFEQTGKKMNETSFEVF